MLARGVSPGSPGPVRSFRRPAAPGGRAGLGVGQKSAVLTADPPFPGSIYSLGSVFLALGHDFGTENPASRMLSTTPAKRCHRLFNIFSPHHLNDLGPWGPSYPASVPYSGTGPRERNLGGMTLVFLPLSATGSRVGPWERYYVRQFRRLNRLGGTPPSAPRSPAKPPPGQENRPLAHA